MEILRSIESQALAVAASPPSGPFIPMDEPGPTVELPLERPLFKPPFRPLIQAVELEEGEAEVDTAPLYDQVVIDPVLLRKNIRRALGRRPQVTLAEVIAGHPLEHGLAELLAYLRVASSLPHTVDEEARDQVSWQTDDGRVRRAVMPRVILMRGKEAGARGSGQEAVRDISS